MFPIPLKPYSYYIEENMRQNDELMATTIGSPLPLKEKADYNNQVGRNYQRVSKNYYKNKSEIKLLW